MLKVCVGAHVYSLCNPWSHTIGFIEKNSYKKKKLIKVGAKKKNRDNNQRISKSRQTIFFFVFVNGT